MQNELGGQGHTGMGMYGQNRFSQYGQYNQFNQSNIPVNQINNNIPHDQNTFINNQNSFPNNVGYNQMNITNGQGQGQLNSTRTQMPGAGKNMSTLLRHAKNPNAHGNRPDYVNQASSDMILFLSEFIDLNFQSISLKRLIYESTYLERFLNLTPNFTLLAQNSG